MSLFGSKIKKEDWEPKGSVGEGELFYHNGHLKWVKNKYIKKYKSDECVLCGEDLTYWLDMYEGFTGYLEEEYGNYDAVLPRNICGSCGVKLYERVTIGF